MRLLFAIIFSVLTVGLGLCAFFSAQSARKMARPVLFLLLALIPPVLGNLVIVLATGRAAATAGYLIYFLGMDAAVFALLHFTFQYCGLSWSGDGLRKALHALLIADTVQLLLNPLFHHAFDLEEILVDGQAYYHLVPYAGQGLHRLVCYGIFLVAAIIFMVKMISAPRIYMERYAVIFLTMVVVGLWETFYIFSGTPVDQSMVGFGVFGLLVYYFAMHYRPMRLLDRMLVQVASHMDDAYFFFDAMERPIWANEAGLRMVGATADEFERINDHLNTAFGRIYLGKSNWKEQRELGEGKNKQYYQLEKQMVLDKRGRLNGSFLIIRDQTEEQQTLQQEKYYSTHDRLTGLYNKECLLERIQWTMAACPDQKYLIMLTDVSNFKLVNDIFGNQFGDQALIQIGEIIRRSVRDQGIYGRIGGDTFGICMRAEAFDPKGTEALMHRIEVSDGKNTHHVVIHMGIYKAEKSDLDVSAMFDRARMALSTIKNDYNTMIAWYSNQMRDSARWDQYISNELPDALSKGQIQPYLQPIVDDHGKTVGAEALVRWIHPVHGFLSPARFVPVFEKNGMIAEVDKYMWRSACKILSHWKETGVDLFLSVNVSPKDFYFMDVEQEIRKIVEEYGVEPSKLRIEITETVMMTDMENRIRMLNNLKKEGFLIEMDDFGSGYSSLNMLKDMPIDLIKIDMAFLRQARDDEKAKTILQNILHLIEELGLISLTEGVETESQYHMLAERGCNLFQGFYFAKPMPVEEYDDYRSRKAS